MDIVLKKGSRPHVQVAKILHTEQLSESSTHDPTNKDDSSSEEPPTNGSNGPHLEECAVQASLLTCHFNFSWHQNKRKGGKTTDT